ncbi:hypothetical protein KVR01_010557 [Diaporthe batatas]|uniref:uncharacterized protein n=1 Tax=Diaporthe batatas TaxID=748121 RepID=UPI001D04ED9E|nr:uncharacterized protein KVR01_010557 [Diaporthe batatas]KAG8159920.1 hypothetical protein KVR01_010557 [Diaporthe batatas]
MAVETLRENTFSHSGDKTTFYWSTGPADGPLVIFTHGWPSNAEFWKQQLLAFGSLGFHAVAPDTRGYGRSSVPKGDDTEYRLEKLVSDMLALLAHLKRDKAVWIGHDWGASLTWSFAAMHPDKCVGVSCISVPYGVLESGGIDKLVSLSNRDIYPEDQYPLAQWDYQAFHEEQPEKSRALLEANVANTIKALYRASGPEVFGKPAFTATTRKSGGWFGPLTEAPETPFETCLYADDKPAFDRVVAEFERNGFEGPNAYYLNHKANGEWLRGAPNGAVLEFPVLFVETKYDTVCDTALSRLAEPMRELCKDLTEVSLDCGHWACLEKPRELNAALVKWVATKLPGYFPGGK